MKHIKLMTTFIYSILSIIPFIVVILGFSTTIFDNPSDLLMTILLILIPLISIITGIFLLFYKRRKYFHILGGLLTIANLIWLIWYAWFIYQVATMPEI